MNNQRWMSQNFFTFYMTWGIFLPYWTGFLIEAKHLTVAQASLIMSCGLIARGISTMFIFPYIASKRSSKHVLNIFAVASLAIVLLFIMANSFEALFLITVIFSIFYPAIMPALDSVAGILVQHGQLHYGKSRSYGSLGFIVMVLIVSVITGKYGDASIVWLLIGGLILVVLLSFRQSPAILVTKPSKKQAGLTSIKKLLTNQQFLFILLIAILLQGAHASYYNYGYIYLQDLGVAKYYIGFIINIGVVFEILFFANADRFFSRWKPTTLLMIAAIGSTVRWLIVSLIPTIPLFVLSQSLHAISFALTHFAVILFFTQNLQKEQIPNAQGLYNAFAMSWSTAALTLFGGYLYEIEPRFAFLGMIVCTIPALLLSSYLRKKDSFQ